GTYRRPLAEQFLRLNFDRVDAPALAAFGKLEGELKQPAARHLVDGLARERRAVRADVPRQALLGEKLGALRLEHGPRARRQRVATVLKHECLFSLTIKSAVLQQKAAGLPMLESDIRMHDEL